MEVEVIQTAVLPMPVAYAFRRDGSPLRRVSGVLRPGDDVILAPCLAFIVRHPDAGLILVDTGMHPDARESLRRDFGVPMSLMFRGARVADEPFDEQLRAVGVDPTEVRHVVMTHLHVDHTSGMRLLPAAEFTCSREEWEATRARLAAAKGYVAHHLPPEARMRLVDFARDGEPYGPFAQTVDLFGDERIRLVSTPGHTPGHLSVLLRLEDDRQVLLAGDAAYGLRSIEDEHLPLITDDDEAALRSLRQLKAFCRANPDAVVVPTHDPQAWRRLERVV